MEFDWLIYAVASCIITVEQTLTYTNIFSWTRYFIACVLITGATVLWRTCGYWFLIRNWHNNDKPSNCSSLTSVLEYYSQMSLYTAYTSALHDVLCGHHVAICVAIRCHHFFQDKPDITQPWQEEFVFAVLHMHRFPAFNTHRINYVCHFVRGNLGKCYSQQFAKTKPVHGPILRDVTLSYKTLP